MPRVVFKLFMSSIDKIWTIISISSLICNICMVVTILILLCIIRRRQKPCQCSLNGQLTTGTVLKTKNPPTKTKKPKESGAPVLPENQYEETQVKIQDGHEDIYGSLDDYYRTNDESTTSVGTSDQSDIYEKVSITGVGAKENDTYENPDQVLYSKSSDTFPTKSPTSDGTQSAKAEINKDQSDIYLNPDRKYAIKKGLNDIFSRKQHELFKTNPKKY